MLHRRQKDNTEDRRPLTLLFFDRYNAEDPLFVADIARRLATAARNGFRAVIVHASDDAAERAREALDAAGSAPEYEREVVERTIRMTNQSITRRLIDEGVSAVSIQGNHRGLFRITEEGTVEIGRTEWLERAISLGGTPVISLLAETADRRVAEAKAASALDGLVSTLSRMWSVTTVYFTTNRKSALFESDGSRLESVESHRLSSFPGVPDVALAAAGIAAHAVFVTNSAGLAPDGTISGTRIT